MNFKTVTPFARRFAERLFSAYPEWADLAVAGCSLHGENALLITVSSPVSADLSICAIDEIEVSWDVWHIHSSDLVWDREDEQREIQATLDEIAHLLSERTIIAVAMKGDQWKMSTSLLADDENAWLNFITTPGDFDRCYARSWTGAKDRTWSAAQAR